jgi:SRSO17 transposase
MLAFAMMAAIRHRANNAPAQQTIPGIFAIRRRSSGGPFRKSAA